MTRTVVAVDVGGTHARFALAEVRSGKVIGLGDPVTMHTRDHSSFQSAWEDFCDRVDTKPGAASIAVAGSVNDQLIRFTNNPWALRPGQICDELGIEVVTIINDFGAVGHAVGQLGPSHFLYLCGPERELPVRGRISIIGPGTGLGIAHVWRDGEQYQVQTTEGGHTDFAPVDAIDDAILARIRRRHSRVSVERVVAGPALVDIYETLAAIEGKAVTIQDEKAIWTVGLDGSDLLAATAVERFCMSLGSVAGDIALAQGGSAVVIAGGLGLRIEPVLRRSGFADRFRFKGRFEKVMADMPVKLITHPQPGLYGAAAAFAQEHA